MVKQRKPRAGGDGDGGMQVAQGAGGEVKVQGRKATKVSAVPPNGRTEEELMMMDPKKVQRILANRQSAAKSKERKQQLTHELETRLAAVKEESERLEGLHSALALDLTTLASYSKSQADEVDELIQRVQQLQTSQAVMVKEMAHAQRVLNLQQPLPDPPLPLPLEPKPLPQLVLPRELPPDAVAAPHCIQALRNPLIPAREMAAHGAPAPPTLGMLGDLRDGSQNHSAAHTCSSSMDHPALAGGGGAVLLRPAEVAVAVNSHFARQNQQQQQQQGGWPVVLSGVGDLHVGGGGLAAPQPGLHGALLPGPSKGVGGGGGVVPRSRLVSTDGSGGALMRQQVDAGAGTPQAQLQVTGTSSLLHGGLAGVPSTSTGPGGTGVPSPFCMSVSGKALLPLPGGYDPAGAGLQVGQLQERRASGAGVGTTFFAAAGGSRFSQSGAATATAVPAVGTAGSAGAQRFGGTMGQPDPQALLPAAAGLPTAASTLGYQQQQLLHQQPGAHNGGQRHNIDQSTHNMIMKQQQQQQLLSANAGVTGLQQQQSVQVQVYGGQGWGQLQNYLQQQQQPLTQRQLYGNVPGADSMAYEGQQQQQQQQYALQQPELAHGNQRWGL